MKPLIALLTGLVVLAFPAAIFPLDQDQPIALVGATIIDVSESGRSTNDIGDGIVIARGKTITDVGRRGRITIPDNARVIDVSGKFLVPGLMDGFAAINNQSYANAHLYMGVTSIIAVSGGRRGELFLQGSPSPTVYRLESIGSIRRSDAELIGDLEKVAGTGARVVLIMYQTTPAQLKMVKAKAEELGLATIGELGYSSYEDGITAGLDAFVHSTRYSLDVAPRDLIEAVAGNPFSDDLGSPKWRYYQYLTRLATDNHKLLAHGQRLGKAATYIMPTFSLLYLDHPESRNPWREPVAQILTPSDINNPASRQTGKHDYQDANQKAYTNLALNILEIEKIYRKHGAKYLAGSGTDVWGTMPGISLHTELEFLHRAGLSPRETLAAATSNFVNAFGWDSIGEIQPGRNADILVLNGNPLENLQYLKDIEILIQSGVILDRKALLKIKD